MMKMHLSLFGGLMRKENEWDMDAMAESRWEWVLNEIIWTFEQLTR
jgi:hypothetical protein